MFVKFGGIWCHPRLAGPEKLPKSGPKSGVCLRGCKMVSFLTKEEKKNCSGQRNFALPIQEKMLSVHCRSDICSV
jgi:hypothetical protein